jgi:Domain of unknown function (DUF6456)
MKFPKRRQEIVTPTSERIAKGQVQIASGPVKSETGDFSIPYIAVDLLDGLFERRVITADEKLAGERFRKWFRLAQLEQLKASDLERPIVDGGVPTREISFQAEHARRQIAKAIRWLGGFSSSAGSVLWHVVGLDYSLRRWNRDHGGSLRNVGDPGSSALLAAALERLARMPWRGPEERS